MHDYVFHEIAFLLLVAAAVGLLGTALRQPVVVSFIVVGIAAAAVFEGAPATVAQITFLAELGVALLLFLVGLTLDWRLVRQLGPVAVATGLGQVTFTAAIGFLLGLGLGLDALSSLYVAVALTFSSTIIIVKLLSDKRELETLHRRDRVPVGPGARARRAHQPLRRGRPDLFLDDHHREAVERQARARDPAPPRSGSCWAWRSGSTRSPASTSRSP